MNYSQDQREYRFSFQDIEYKTRAISLSEFGNVLISTNALNKVLLDERGAYTSELAPYIDEQIFYYVEEAEILLPNYQLKQLLTKQIR